MKPDPGETPEERFRRLATARTNAILGKLDILGNLSNRHAYSYTQEEIEKIFGVIDRKMREVKSRFYFRRGKEFKL